MFYLTCFRFFFKDLFFAFDTPAVSAKLSVRTDHPVAWRYDRNRIGRTGSRHRTNRLWVPNRFSDPCVRTGLAIWDLSKLRPDADLESAGPQIERKSKDSAVALEPAQDSLYRMLQLGIVFVYICRKKFGI